MSDETEWLKFAFEAGTGMAGLISAWVAIQMRRVVADLTLLVERSGGSLRRDIDQKVDIFKDETRRELNLLSGKISNVDTGVASYVVQTSERFKSFAERFVETREQLVEKDKELLQAIERVGNKVDRNFNERFSPMGRDPDR